MNPYLRDPCKGIYRYLFALVLTAGMATAIAGDAIRIESPQAQVTLLELYTSEGCSSCPPPERVSSITVCRTRVPGDYSRMSSRPRGRFSSRSSGLGSKK